MWLLQCPGLSNIEVVQQFCTTQCTSAKLDKCTQCTSHNSTNECTCSSFFFNILHLNAEECLHIRINVSLRRDKYDFNVSSEKLHWGTILLSTVSKA